MKSNAISGVKTNLNHQNYCRLNVKSKAFSQTPNVGKTEKFCGASLRIKQLLRDPMSQRTLYGLILQESHCDREMRIPYPIFSFFTCQFYKLQNMTAKINGRTAATVYHSWVKDFLPSSDTLTFTEEFTQLVNLLHDTFCSLWLNLIYKHDGLINSHV